MGSSAMRSISFRWSNGRPQWSWPQIYPIARAMKSAAQAEHVTIEWGGDWRTLRDGPHYPAALRPLSVIAARRRRA